MDINFAIRTAAAQPGFFDLENRLRVLRAKTQTFDGWSKDRKFRNPETGTKVKFDSLPDAQQKKVREHWKQGQSSTKDEPKDSVHEILDDYKLEIVGDNKDRAQTIAKKISDGIHASADFCKANPPACEGNLGIPRSSMPQIMDESVKSLLASKDAKKRKKGQAAVDAGASPDSTKTIMDDLLDTVKSEGTKIESAEVSVGQLKATQREIKAKKSYGMADAYFSGDFDPSADVEIVISSDNHILDGHHRWASLLLADPTKTMKVKKVDIPMREFLRKSLDHPGVFRADLQDNIIPEDAPLEGHGPPKKKAVREDPHPLGISF